MTIATLIAPHLPYLRRFARALVGNQAGGDAYTVETLHALIEQPSIFSEQLAVRPQLVKLFLKIWSSVSVNEKVTDSGGSTPAAHLAALTPISRVAFLLTSVEEFSTADVAFALDCPESEALTLIEAAQQELGGQIATDVLIIEDEPVIALDLDALMRSRGHRVIGIATTHAEAVALAQRDRPGLVLADVRLADGSSGIEAVKQILKTIDVPVIFITAFPEQLLTGDGLEPTYLVTKPFKMEALLAIVGQALFFSHSDRKPT